MPEAPVEEVMEMHGRGEGDEEIISYLAKKGYSPSQISEALNLAKIKSAVSNKKEKNDNITGLSPSILESSQETIEAPAPERAEAQPQYEQQYAAPEAYGEYAEGGAGGVDTETIEEIAEEIVNEKWEGIKDKISDLIEWKEYTEKRLKGMDDHVKRIESSLDSLQVALIGKVQEYGQNIKNLGKEMQDLEGAFSKVLSPLVTNVKELDRITEKLKTKSTEKIKK